MRNNDFLYLNNAAESSSKFVKYFSLMKASRRGSARMHFLAFALFLAFARNVIAELDTAEQPRVRVLTDGIFDVATMDGKPWILMIYSPSCSHCRRMLPILDEAAAVLESEGILVGKINGVENQITSNRFHITKYPSVFLLKGGQSWEYPGPWRTKELLSFVRTGHLTADPIPWYRNPTHAISRVYGLMLSVPSRVFDIYQHYHKEKGYSEMALIGMGLGSVLGVGILFIVIMDCFYAVNPHLLELHPHRD